MRKTEVRKKLQKEFSIDIPYSEIDDSIKNNIALGVKPNEIDIPSNVITKEGFVQTFPFLWSEKGGMDGFFIARLMKSY